MGFFGDAAWRILRAKPFDSVRPKLIRSDVYRLEGKTRFSGSPFSTIVLGSKISVEYFSKFFYMDEPKVESLGKISLSKVASFGAKLSADLVIVESSWFFSRFLYDSGFFVSPRVDFVLDINDSLEVIQNRATRDKRRRLKQVAEAGYTFEVSKDLGRLESFYYDVYLPHMLKRHSKVALPISFSECRELFSRGALLLVKLGEECVSGNLLVPHGTELHSPVVGVTDIDNHLTLGSYSAYYFSILVGIQQGFARMDFGEAPPFMSDGLFQFKRDMGMWVRPAKGVGAQVFGVRFSGVPESLRRFLSVYAFVFMVGDELSGLVFLESVDDLSVRSFCVSGLACLFVVSSCVDVSSLKGFKVEKLSVEESLRNNGSALRFLGRVCVEGKYSLYRLTW